MFGKNTLRWLILLSLITAIMGWWAQQTQESWTFYIVVATFGIMILGILIHLLRIWIKKRQLDGIQVRYLIPQQKYPEATFNGAPKTEIWANKLTVSIGTYKILHRLAPKVSMLVDAPAFYFEGSDENKPKVYGIDNPYKVKRIERIDGVYYRDWWGNVQQDVPNYPKYYHHGNVYAMGNRVQTFGEWKGKCCIEIPVRDEKIITIKMDFSVTNNPDQDNIPFLKVRKQR